MKIVNGVRVAAVKNGLGRVLGINGEVVSTSAQPVMIIFGFRIESGEMNRKTDQEWIDICFSLVLTATTQHPDVSDEFKKKMQSDDNDFKANWVAEQLKHIGFDTEPCGMSWGVLK